MGFSAAMICRGDTFVFVNHTYCVCQVCAMHELSIVISYCFQGRMFLARIIWACQFIQLLSVFEAQNIRQLDSCEACCVQLLSVWRGLCECLYHGSPKLIPYALSTEKRGTYFVNVSESFSMEARNCKCPTSYDRVCPVSSVLWPKTECLWTLQRRCSLRPLTTQLGFRSKWSRTCQYAPLHISVFDKCVNVVEK